MGGVSNIQEYQQPITIKDEGLSLQKNPGSIDFAGGGVTGGTASGAVTETIPGGGGGGFTTLSATETPNGTIKVFTFSTATAQPSFVVSDNVMMSATSKAGTVNWTWNAGAKQATVSIPPTDDIIAIV